MYEIKSSRSEGASSYIQKFRRCVKLAEGLSKTFPDELPLDADNLNETPNADNFFKPSKKVPIRKRTSIRKPTKRLDVNNLDNFMEMESGIASDSRSIQDDGKARSQAEPTNVCIPFSGVSPFSIENIDMRTKEGRLLKESIKAQVKKITVIKRAQNRSEQSILNSMHAMKHGIDVADPSARSDAKSYSIEMPECQSNSLPNVLGKETEHTKVIPIDARLLKNSEKEAVVEMALARRSRKRQWRTNVEVEPDMTHVVTKNASSHSTAVLTEELCEDLVDTSQNAREHLTTVKEETRLRKSGMKDQVKKVTFDQNLQKKSAKINLNYPLEMNSEAGDHPSSMLGNAESQYSAESTKRLCSTFSDALAGSDAHLHDNAEEELLTSGFKEPIRRSRKRQVKNNLDHPLQINSTEDCSLSTRAGSQRNVQLSESLHSTVTDVPEGAAEDLPPSTDEGHLSNAAPVGAVKKMTLLKKPRNKSEKNNSEHVLEIKSEMGKDSSIIVRGDLEPCRTIEPTEGHSHASIQPLTAEDLHTITKEESLLKANERGEFSQSALVKNVRKRPAKNGSDHVHEMQREACDDSSLLRRKSQSSSINEPPKGPSVNFSEVQADVSEHLNPKEEEARLISLNEKEDAQKAFLIKQSRKRPMKSHSNHKTGEASLFHGGMESRYSVERPEGQCEFANLPVGDAGHVSSGTQLVKAKGAVQNVPVIRNVRKRPERVLDQMLAIKSKANGTDSSLQEDSKPLVDDSASQRSSEVQERLCNAFSAVPIDAADHLQSKKEEGSLFKPELQRAVKKMTLSQKPRTGLEKDCDRVLQMKSERVDDSVYSAQSNTVFRYSMELPERLCSGFPSAQQQASEAMDIRTVGGRLCLFTASKNAPVKKRAPVKKTILKPETSLPNPHEMEMELGDDASSSLLGESESLSVLDLPENPSSGIPDVPLGASENMNISADEASFLQESPKVCARNVTLIEEGIEESELDNLFEMKNRSGDDAVASVMEDSESRSSFEFPDIHGTIFPDVSPHTAEPTELDTEEGNLFNAIVKEEEKKRPLIEDNGPGPEGHFDSVLEVKKEELGSLLQEDSETRLSADVAGNIDVLPNTNVDMSTEGTFLGLFDPDKKVRKRPPSKKQLDGQEEGTFEPLLKKRGRKKKDPEMEILHDGEVRVKQKGKLISKDLEEGVKPRKKGKVSESGFANDGVFAPDGETNLDFGEIFDAVLAEACKWELSKDPEHLARLGLGEGITGTGRLKAPPMSDNDLYSSGDEAEESPFGFAQPYERNKLTSMKKHRECVQASQVEKRKTSPYFSKRSTEGEHPRDDVMAAGEDTISGYEDASDDLLDPIFTDTDEESEDLDLGNHSGASLNGAGPSGLNSNAPSVEQGEVVQGVDVNCKTVEGAILKTEQKQLCVVKNINDQLRRMERHLANLVKFNRLYIRRSIGLTGELVRENASQSLSLQRIAETLESAIPFPAASGIRLTADTAPTSSSSSVSSDSSDEEWAKRPSKTPKRSKRNREEGATRGRKKK